MEDAAVLGRRSGLDPPCLAGPGRRVVLFDPFPRHRPEPEDRLLSLRGSTGTAASAQKASLHFSIGTGSRSGSSAEGGGSSRRTAPEARPPEAIHHVDVRATQGFNYMNRVGGTGGDVGRQQGAKSLTQEGGHQRRVFRDPPGHINEGHDLRHGASVCQGDRAGSRSRR